MEINWQEAGQFLSGILLIIGCCGLWLENRELKKRIRELEQAQTFDPAPKDAP